MKKIISILLLATFCIFTQLHAQNRADELMKQAQENLTKKEYIKARYLFLQAYNAFATQDKYAQAVECGVNASALYHRENYYKEAFELLRGAEQVVATGEQKTGKAMPNLRFRINKERLQMYINLKNPARAKEQLTKLEETAKASHNDSLSNDLLYTQANYYYTFGMNAQGDAATNRLIGQYKEQKNYAKVDECYKTLISIARKANNAGLVARTYDKYILWTDSVKALTAQDELNVLKKKYDESLATIQEKDDSLSAKQYIIIGLCCHPCRSPDIRCYRIVALHRPYPQAEESHRYRQRAQRTENKIHPKHLRPDGTDTGHARRFAAGSKGPAYILQPHPGTVRIGEHLVRTLRNAREEHLRLLRGYHGQD